MHYSQQYLYALQQQLYNTACIIVTPACMLQVQYNIKYQYRYYILYIILVIYYLWLVGIPLDSTSKMFTSFPFSFHLLPLIILISIFVTISSIAFVVLGLAHTSTSINKEEGQGLRMRVWLGVGLGPHLLCPCFLLGWCSRPCCLLSQWWLGLGLGLSKHINYTPKRTHQIAHIKKKT